MAVERLLSDRAVPLDLVVYTPRELHEVYAAGEPFVEEVMETGRVLYMRRGRRPPRTHDLVELLRAVTEAGSRPGLAMDDAVFLNSIYRGRYPTEQGLLPHGEPTAEEAARAVRVAGQVLGRVRAEVEAASEGEGGER